MKDYAEYFATDRDWQRWRPQVLKAWLAPFRACWPRLMEGVLVRSNHPGGNGEVLELYRGLSALTIEKQIPGWSRYSPGECFYLGDANVLMAVKRAPIDDLVADMPELNVLRERIRAFPHARMDDCIVFKAA